MNNYNSSITATTLPGRLHSAFAQPIKIRCDELENIIRENGLKELHGSVPLLIEMIFGTGGACGWDLLHIYKTQYEFKTVRRFLSPNGPLLTLLHRLVYENCGKYEFPISSLPNSVRSSLSQGTIPGFYSSKLHYSQRSPRGQSSIALDATELYFFHFANHLMNVKAGIPSQIHKADDALYGMLLDDYLQYYLPVVDAQNLPNISAGSQPHPSHRPGVPILQIQADASTLIQNAHTLIQVIQDFWLCQHSYDDESVMLTSSGSKDTVLPTTSHMRMIRIFIKHLHYFNNRELSSSLHNSISYAWSELKRMIPQMIQQPLYIFMRYVIRHWPLDTSFRLVLEAWLSYIQPWRYQDFNQVHTSRDKSNTDSSLDPKWKYFIQENLLFYTSLYQIMLPQIFRMDLTVPKNVYMFFRVCKVYNQANLRDYIYDAESSLCDSGLRSTARPSLGAGVDLGATYIPPTPQPTHLHLLDTTQTPGAIQHLEPNYTPLFAENTIASIRRLLQVLVKAHHSAEVKVSHRGLSDDSNTSIWSLFGGSPGDLNVSMPSCSRESASFLDDYGGGNDVKKMPVNLQHIIEFLTDFFKLELPTNLKSVSYDGDFSRNPPDHILTENGPKLTPLGRYQVMNNIRKFDIKYQGDPELQPIRSFEIAALARFLYYISTYINTMYASQIRSIYYRTDIIGGMARQFLQQPLPLKKRPAPIIHPVSPRPKHSMCSDNNDVENQPRISLRWLASKQNLGYILGIYFILYGWLGIGPISYIMLCLLGFLISLLFLSFSRPVSITGDNRSNVYSKKDS